MEKYTTRYNKGKFSRHPGIIPFISPNEMRTLLKQKISPGIRYLQVSDTWRKKMAGINHS